MSNKLAPTPKTMRQAILNGLDTTEYTSVDGVKAAAIEQHVADFIRQKLTPIYGRATMEENQDVIKVLVELQKNLGI